MDISNRDVEFYSTLLVRLYDDIVDGHNVNNRTLKYERATLRKRMREEGLSFATQTLPALGKAIDLALATDTPLVTTFRKARGSQLPRFLGWLLRDVFDPVTGRPYRGGWEYACQHLEILGENDQTIDLIWRSVAPRSLRSIRQFVYVLYKLEIPYEESKTQKVLHDFVTTDESLAESDNRITADDNILRRARVFTSSVFGVFDEMDILPSHGPGAVSTGESVIEKSKFSRLYGKIEQKYPFTEYFMFNLNHVVDSYPDLGTLEHLHSGTAKVVLVPKDSRGPRLISCEPLEYQWMQQGLGRKMVAHLERHPLTRGHVNFTCQQVNRDLALLASAVPWTDCPTYHRLLGKYSTADWVTLDMKEASDRVSLKLVETIFELVPGLLDALCALRTERTTLPSGRQVALKKYAPMGSSLCFPVESYVFYALVVATLVETAHLTRREARRSVYVYGDDIILRREYYPLVMQSLERYGLLFNSSKCCTAGFFRESCGCDAYLGIDVTPTRLRAVWSSRRLYDPSILYGYAAFSNAMYLKGYFGVANYIRSHIVKVYGEIPYSNEALHCPLGTLVEKPWFYQRVAEVVGGSGVVFYTNEGPARDYNKNIKHRFHPDFHVLQYKTWGVVAKKAPASSDSYSELLRRITCGWLDDTESYAVRHRSRLQRRWTAV